MAIKALSMDFWQTIATPNPEYSKARTEYFTQLFGVEPEVADARYKQIKRHADDSAVNFGQSISTIALIKMVIYEKNLTRETNATKVYFELMEIATRHTPIVEKSMYELLARVNKVLPICITSNTNFIPGQVLKHTMPLLTDYTFSDEVGICKPLPEIFEWTYTSLRRRDTSLRKEDIVHIGDHIKCDIAGADRFGFKTHKVRSPLDTEVYLHTLLERVTA